MSSAFDIDTFMQTTIAEPNDTVIEPVPAGEYHAIVKSFNINTGRTTKAGDPIYPMDVVWSIQNPELKAKLKREEVVSRQSIFLDITDAGALDMGKGKNVGLGRLREALGLNTPGTPFSFTALSGAGPAKISVKHEVDKNGITRDRVQAVGKL